MKVTPDSTDPSEQRVLAPQRCALIMADAQDFASIQAAMQKLVDRFEAVPIPYAIIGGLAVRYYGHRRFTNDIDVLVTPQAHDKIVREFIGHGYRLDDAQTGRMVDEEYDVKVDLCLSDGSVRWPSLFRNTKEIDGVQVIRLTRLIDMKLATGRLQDAADVLALIKHNRLERTFCRGLSASNVDAWNAVFDRFEMGE